MQEVFRLFTLIHRAGGCGDVADPYDIQSFAPTYCMNNVFGRGMRSNDKKEPTYSALAA